MRWPSGPGQGAKSRPSASMSSLLQWTMRLMVSFLDDPDGRAWISAARGLRAMSDRRRRSVARGRGGTAAIAAAPAPPPIIDDVARDCRATGRRHGVSPLVTAGAARMDGSGVIADVRGDSVRLPRLAGLPQIGRA